MTKHTLEPWQTRDETYVALGRQFIAPGVTAEERRFYARRIVACVNACAGIPTEALEEVSQFMDEWDRLGCLRDVIEGKRRDLARQP